jgi:hypothetical protein
MKVKTLSSSIFVVVILLVLGTGCGKTGKSTTTTITAIQPTASTTLVQPKATAGGLSAEEIITLRSLERVNDYPFYIMHYSGNYAYPRLSSHLLAGNSIGCSLFTTLGDSGDKLYGRNFDWDYSPALLVFTHPPDGYASASMVDLTFLGMSANDAKALTDRPVEERTDLLAAPSLPFDGMNEYGLTIGIAAVPGEYADDVSYDPSKTTIGSIGIIRQALDHARNVDEALEIFEQYNISFSGGPPIHYLLADRSGKAVLVEFYQHEMVQLYNENPWHLATNHLRCIAQGDSGCWRYDILDLRLRMLNGHLDTRAAMQLLSAVKQESTQWSAVYDMTSGDIHVAIGRDYETSYTFHLELVKE